MRAFAKLDGELEHILDRAAPLTRTVSICKVLTDGGILQRLPTVLLFEGDSAWKALLLLQSGSVQVSLTWTDEMPVPHEQNMKASVQKILLEATAMMDVPGSVDVPAVVELRSTR